MDLFYVHALTNAVVVCIDMQINHDMAVEAFIFIAIYERMLRVFYRSV